MIIYSYVKVPITVVLTHFIARSVHQNNGVKYKSVCYFHSRIPSYFGTIDPIVAAKKIIEAMRRDYMEVSIPGYLLYADRVVR
jgi:hypothetical protein